MRGLFCFVPPYWGHEDDYGKDMFSREEFEELAGMLGSIKGRFLLSLNDVPEVRELFKDFPFTTLQTKYTAARKKDKNQVIQELLIHSAKK